MADQETHTFETNRVLGLSDAVIAIVITLMAVELLQLDVAQGDESLAKRLVTEWPAYVAYTVSFLIIGQIWVTHRAMWSAVRRTDDVMVLLNLALLFFTSAIPFATKILSQTLRSGEGEVPAAGLYVATILGEAVAFNATWHWARARGHLDTDLTREQIAATSTRYALGPLLYLAAFALSFVGLGWSLAAFFGLTLFYLRPHSGGSPRETGHRP